MYHLHIRYGEKAIEKYWKEAAQTELLVALVVGLVATCEENPDIGHTKSPSIVRGDIKGGHASAERESACDFHARSTYLQPSWVGMSTSSTSLA